VGLVKKPSLSSVVGRGLRLGKLGVSLTGSYLGYQAQNFILGEGQSENRKRDFHERASRLVRQELGLLKGAAMKLGQMLSMQTQALPEGAIEELAQLQMRAPGMHPTLVRAQFKASLGKYPEEVFDEFEPEPFAAASLGQVHRARTRGGERVAVKIQYPAIRGAIESDFKLLRSAMLPARVSGHVPVAILDELQRGILEEADYLQEARNIEFFRKGLRGFDYVDVPLVHEKLTTDRVLTMSFVEGEPMEDFLTRKPSSVLRDRIGDHLVELHYYQHHRLRALHADHHPGNYLFQSDGRIGLVDFGCVKYIAFDATDLIRCCLRRSWREGEAEARRVLDMVSGGKVSLAQGRPLLSIFDHEAEILFPEGPAASPIVNFGNAELLENLVSIIKKVLSIKAANPEFVFSSRADLGLYSLLHRLGARVNVGEVWRRLDR
jgi:predicted unusual protein kinase regulating ubiquinone biosynthesis (AarF/ABC1/UbiB family)